MPTITIQHQPLIQGKHRENLVNAITNFYREVTDTGRSTIRIIFSQFDNYSVFSEGIKEQGYVRIVAQIPLGTDAERKQDVLRGLYEIALAAHWTPQPVGEIETQVVEIDERNVMINGVMKMATPAEPILASTLWTAHLSLSESAADTSSTSKTSPTGSRKIDSALKLGLDYGRIHCISGENESGAREFAQALLVSHLLSNPTATATVIDTAFSLDVRKLHLALMRREGANAETAAKILDRVEIMKVFDFEGMTESLAEMRDVLRGKIRSNIGAEPDRIAPKGTIGDSEDEDEDEEELLLDPTPRAPQPISPPSIEPPTTGSKPRMLIIDNITRVTAPLLKNNYVQGQAVLSSFMRSLYHLTTAHNLYTVILNGASPAYKLSDECPSAFSSCTLQPALGKSFAYLPDVHLLVHRMQKTAGGKGIGNEVSVIEVLHDRYGDRVGRWAPFIVEEAGLLAELP